MAETVTEKVIEEVVKAVAENGTDTEKAVMAPEGMLLAYSSLMLMALFPVYLGSLKSIIYHAKQKVGIFFKYFFIFCIVVVYCNLIFCDFIA